MAEYVMDSYAKQEKENLLDSSVVALADGLAIVSNGNTHAAIAKGQFVYVRNHGTLAEGLYKASAAIAANATLTSSNLTADSNGGLNALNEQMANLDSQLNGLFSHNSSGSTTPTRNGDTTIWTATSDCLAFINVVGTCDAGGGYMRAMLKKNNVVLSEGYTIPSSITTGAYPSNITVCGIAHMKAGDVFKITTGFSNNANPKTFFWNVVY